MNEKATKLLEFDAIRSKVAALALSEESGRIIMSEEPQSDKVEVQKQKSLVLAGMKRNGLCREEKSGETFP